MTITLVVRKRRGSPYYWIGRIIEGTFVPYADAYGPTGYGFLSKATAKQQAAVLAAELNARTQELMKGDQEQ